MIPKTLSATSLLVAGLCLARWEVEYLDRVRGSGTAAASTGSAVHGGLEKYVEMCYIDRTHEPSLKLLTDLYQISFIEVFQHADFTSAEYKDGESLIKKWFKRTSFDGFSVLSVEVKKNVAIPYEHPDGLAHQPCDNCFNANRPGICFVPLNYIMDRVDKVGPGRYRVVDYKTVRAPIMPEDLRSKPQVRIYALAVQIEHPDAEEIEVCFDLLRHDPVSTWISRDDNIATWDWLKAELKRLVDTPAGPPPTINPECGYCPVKATCKPLQSNVDAGGLHSLSIEDAAGLKFKLESQLKGIEYLLAELDEKLLLEAYQRDELEFPAGELQVEIKAMRRRQLDTHMVADIIGPELFAQLGRFNVGTYEDLIKGDEITPQQKEALKAAVSYTYSDPSAKVKPAKKGLV